MEKLIDKTTKVEQKIAKSSATKFRETSRKIIKREGKAIKIKFQDNDEFVEIPKKAFYLLIEILDNMAEGKSVTLLPSESHISTQVAADILHVSRPHLVKLLEEGKIPYKKTGSHRRIELNAIIAYNERIQKIRDEKLKFLAQQAQELNMGY